jgi:ATP-binding cassette subfamily B protein
MSQDEKIFTSLWMFIGIEFGLAILSDILNRLINLTDALLGDLFANRSSVLLIEKAATLDLSMFEDPDFYDRLERARRQTTTRVSLMSQVLSQLQDTITIIFLGVGLVVFEPLLIVLLIIAVVPSFLSEAYFSRSGYSLVRSWTAERRELDYLRFIGASDVTAKEVKIFNLAGFLKKRFASLADRYYKANKKLAVKRTLWGTILHTLSDTAYYGAYVFIVMRTVAGFLTVGDLTFLSGTFNRLRNQLQTILTRFNRITESALYLQDYFDFMAIEPSIKDDENAALPPDQIVEGFVFENVGFQYPGSEFWAVRNLNFTLHAGEKLALVGENGAGKTTIVKLLARMYDPTEGRILLDGRDIKNFKLGAFRKMIGVIFQDFVRFALKASENIAIGNIEELTDRSKIINSAEKSLADPMIQHLPEKYEQMLGKRFAKGVELSGGEWQKVALARAYMRNAQLVILDEPTASLDARAEFEVFQRFAELTLGKTAVLISHRFSTVRMADRILVLKKGEMEEIGDHETLLANRGLYAELFELQAKGYQ